MKLAFIGLGQAGGKIVDQFLDYEAHTKTDFITSAHAINTARADLAGLDRIPRDNQVLIGQARVKGHGVGADNELATQIASEDIDEIMGALDDIPVHEIDGFLLIAGLGGGTGSGVGPVLANQLKRVYTEPVYGLGILPASTEGSIYTLNAARSLQTYVRETDNLLLFDNDAWRTEGETLQSGYVTINDELVRRFGVLFSAGEIDSRQDVAESVVDSSEIINTLASGGIAAVGHASADLNDQRPGILSRLLGRTPDQPDEMTATNRITSLIRQAALGRVTLPCELTGVERALVVVSGPPAYLNRKGIERGRKWLEEQTGSMQIRGGDYPLPGENTIAATVLLSGLSNVQRIDSLKQQAVDAHHGIDEMEAAHESQTDDLIDNDQLDPLF